MIQSGVQSKVAASRPAVNLPPGIFLTDPENAARIDARLRLWNRYKKEAVAFLLLSILGVLVFWITVEGIRPLLLHGQIQQYGVAATGTVEGKHTATAGGYQQVTYYLEYHFTDLSGEHYDSAQSVSRAVYENTMNGTSIPLKYLPDDPGQSELAGGLQNAMLNFGNMLIAAISGIGFVMLAILLGYLGRYVWRENRFFTRGSLLMGHVLSCHGHTETTAETLGVQTYGGETGGPYRIDLTYTFHSPKGKTLKSSLKRERSDLRHIGLPTFGTPVAVLYLDDQHYKIL